MDQLSNAASTSNASTSTADIPLNTTPLQPSGVLFREIHKNAWLKRLPNSEKRTGAFPKKGDRVWVVFCVHDDVEAFLETYVDQKVAAAHKPEWYVSLNNCIHVSPTICGQDDEFEFVVTLNSDLVRLTAPSWDTMMEWVETIRSKLREMKILSPRENIYSKMPEARLPLAPTRDPNSPLPLPPPGPSTLVPGVEPSPLSDHSASSSSSTSPSSISTIGSSSSSDSSDDNTQSANLFRGFRSRTNSRQGDSNTQINSQFVASNSQTVQYDDVSLEVGSSTTSLYITQPELYSHAANSTTVAPVIGTADNVTVIRVSNQQHADSPENSPVFNFNFVEETLPSVPSEEVDGNGVEINEAYFTPPLTPSVPTTISNTSIVPSVLSAPATTVATTYSVVIPNRPITPLSASVTNSPARRVETSPRNGTSESPRASSNHYECVFLPRNVPEGEQRRRRGTGRGEGESRLQPAPHPYRQQGPVTGNVAVVSLSRLTLREQQVIQLRTEMLHPGGIRLQLRRKDCTGSIALVDAFGGVWITGWKQREHPMLYNALHIGDQLISIAGVLVQNASDAQKHIRSATSLYVEFVIRRVPFGRVFAIRRDTDGQALGIVQDGNTAVIRDVAPEGPAARHGLTAKVQSCDGLSLTPWVLTEVNGRPLNLFFKDNEVRDRLNAVGREISILVQPFDLVKQLKKQLKSLRGYKDYIVQ